MVWLLGYVTRTLADQAYRAVPSDDELRSLFEERSASFDALLDGWDRAPRVTAYGRAA